ncbi:MAG: PAS domain S-box protein, partial [Desulfobacterales bacterium]|nr:PAS domain S-box protein [Desulfobacterales bacterium]
HPFRRALDAISRVKTDLDDLFKERGRAERINRALFRISNAVNTALNLDEVYESIHHALADNMDTTNFYIALYDKQEDALSFPYFIDETIDVPVCARRKTGVLDYRSLTSRIIRFGKPLYLQKNDILKLYEKQGEMPSGRVSEVWLGVPLRAGGEVIGAMVAQSYTDAELYDERDVDFLVSVSEQAAIAIQRKRAEEALLLEKAHIERLFEGVPEGVVLADANGVVLKTNPEFTLLFGLAPEEARGACLDDLIVPEKGLEEARAITRRVGGGEKMAFEAVRQRKDGTLLHTSVIAAPIDVGPDRIGQYTIFRDITGRKRANNILLALYNISRAVNSTKSLDELFKLIHQSLDCVLDTTNFFIALYNKKTDVVSFPYFVDEEDDVKSIVGASKTNSLTTRVINGNKALFFDEATLRGIHELHGGKILGTCPRVWLGVPLSIKGDVIGAVVLQSYTDPNVYSEKDIAVLESISEQIAIAIDSKRTEQALSESEKRYKTLFDNAGDAIFFHDMGRGFLDVNAVACERYGYSREEFLKMSPGDLVAPGAERRASVTMETPRESGPFISETNHARKDGSILPCELNNRIIQYNGKPAALSIARDLTERKRAEKEKRRMETQLQNARKMEAIGTLAGGVAHDLNNILSGLVSYPELLLLDLPEESPLREGILLIQKSGNRAAAIVQDLLTLARRGVVVTEVVDLNRIVAERLESPEHRSLRGHHPRARVKTDLDPDLLKIMGSPVHLSKTVMNLASNAAEAMPDGGDIVISTRNQYLDRPVKGYDDVRAGDYVTLTVSDDGPGILPVDMERIFEPFYTKKVMGRSGTGLGMAVV